MVKIVRDLADTSSYWAALWTMCTMPDVHVICDAPIGCFNLVATAIPDYTDAVPHIENVTPSVITEKEVGGTGTGPAVQRTYEGLRDEGLLEGKYLIVVSTAESEMIGSDLSDLVTQLKPGTTFFHSESLTEDEHTGRDRTLQWLWENYGAAQAGDVEVVPGLVNIIGATYGNFNQPSDIAEVKRLVEGAGGTVNVIFPEGTLLSNIADLAKAQVNIVMYKEFGHTLADTLGQPWLHAPFGIQETTDFIRRLGDWLDTREQADAFIKQEKKTTLQTVWDLWRGPQSDWFATTSVGISATGTYVDGISNYLGQELGMQIAFVAPRPRGQGDMNNSDVRKILHDRPPTFVYGSINEKIYLSEAGARMTNFIPAAFPGPVVRRSIGTPFMGYRGAVVLIQDIVNHLYESLYNFLPVDTAYANQRAGQGGANGAPQGPPRHQGNVTGNLPWQTEAKAILDAAVDKLPFLARISASRELQMRVETQAHDRGLGEITPDLAAEVLEMKSE